MAALGLGLLAGLAPVLTAASVAGLAPPGVRRPVQDVLEHLGRPAPVVLAEQVVKLVAQKKRPECDSDSDDSNDPIVEDVHDDDSDDNSEVAAEAKFRTFLSKMRELNIDLEEELVREVWEGVDKSEAHATAALMSIFTPQEAAAPQRSSAEDADLMEAIKRSLDEQEAYQQQFDEVMRRSRAEPHPPSPRRFVPPALLIESSASSSGSRPARLDTPRITKERMQQVVIDRLADDELLVNIFNQVTRMPPAGAGGEAADAALPEHGDRHLVGTAGPDIRERQVPGGAAAGPAASSAASAVPSIPAPSHHCHSIAASGAVPSIPAPSHHCHSIAASGAVPSIPTPSHH
eukprot:Hpha_TRINITY_DN16811_c3_g2::TRINITY_DN16811_c3_g2_i1::g.151281::m.151281